MDMSGGKQVCPTSHHRDAICRIIQRCGKVITGRRILAPQHNIAKLQRLRPLFTAPLIYPHQWPCPSHSPRHIEPQSRTFIGQIAVPTRAGIDRPIRPHFARRYRYFRARACTGIEQPHFAQPFNRCPITGDPGRLRRDFPPSQTQPRQIGAEGVSQFRTTSRPVDIFNPQQEFATCRPRAVMRHNRGISMPKMQRTIRTGGKTSADHACRSSLPSFQRKLWTGPLFPA